MTLKEFVKECGSQEKAARKIGVTMGTVRRWISGKKPSELSLRALDANGVSWASQVNVAPNRP